MTTVAPNPNPKPKGRRSKHLDDSQIKIILQSIQDKVLPLPASNYHIESILIKELELAKIDLVKCVPGRGRKKKFYLLTEKGEQYLKDNV